MSMGAFAQSTVGIQAEVMYTGKAAVRMARPTSAGFQTLNPRPPINSLLMNIAATAPIIGSQYGTPGGITKAIKMPVITALPSLTATDLPRAFAEIASTTTQEMMLTTVMSSPLSPKLY